MLYTYVLHFPHATLLHSKLSFSPGTVKEILGTCQSVGCTVDGSHPHDMVDQINDGNVTIPVGAALMVHCVFVLRIRIVCRLFVVVVGKNNWLCGGGECM